MKSRCEIRPLSLVGGGAAPAVARQLWRLGRTWPTNMLIRRLSPETPPTPCRARPQQWPKSCRAHLVCACNHPAPETEPSYFLGGKCFVVGKGFLGKYMSDSLRSCPWFCYGGYAVPLTQPLCCVLDGKTLLHGVWVPPSFKFAPRKFSPPNCPFHRFDGLCKILVFIAL